MSVNQGSTALCKTSLITTSIPHARLERGNGTGKIALYAGRRDVRFVFGINWGGGARRTPGRHNRRWWGRQGAGTSFRDRPNTANTRLGPSGNLCPTPTFGSAYTPAQTDPSSGRDPVCGTVSAESVTETSEIFCKLFPNDHRTLCLALFVSATIFAFSINLLSINRYKSRRIEITR